MSTATDVASAGGPPAAPVKDAARRDPRRLDVVLLAVVAAGTFVVNAIYAGQGWFFSDDLIQFRQAAQEGLTPAFLGEKAIVHFSPGSRFFVWLVEAVAPLDFHFALFLLLVFQCASAVLLQRTLAALFGRAWWTFAVALAFGLSTIYLPAIQWYSAGLLSVPATTFSLACIHAYVLWWRTGERRWRLWSVGALCLALLFYEKAVLVPVYLVAMTVLLLEPGRSPRAALRRLRWRTWLPYAAPLAIYAVVYLAGDYRESGSEVSLAVLPKYLRVAWAEAFVPGLFGVRVPSSNPDATHVAAIVVSQLVLIGAVAVSILRRRSAWRTWAFLAGAFLINMLLVAPRIGAWGPGIAHVLRYYTELAYLVPLVVPFAFTTPVPRRALRTDQPLVPPRTLTAVGVGALLAVYIGLVVWSDSEASSTFTGVRTHAWAKRLDADLTALRKRAVTPVVLDDQVPPFVVVGFSSNNRQIPAPNSLAYIVPLFDSRVRFDAAPGPTFRVAANGSLRRVQFVPVETIDISALRRRHRATLTGGSWTNTLGTTCTTGGFLSDARLEIAQQPPLRGRRLTILVDYRTSPDTPVLITSNPGLGYGEFPRFGLPPAPGGARRFLRVPVLPTGIPTFAGIRFYVPPGKRVCFGRLTLGWFRDSAAGA